MAVPALLGSGKRVFAGGTVPMALRLTESVTWPTGTLQLTYETPGVPTYGNLAIERTTCSALPRADKRTW